MSRFWCQRCHGSARHSLRAELSMVNLSISAQRGGLTQHCDATTALSVHMSLLICDSHRPVMSTRRCDTRCHSFFRSTLKRSSTASRTEHSGRDNLPRLSNIFAPPLTIDLSEHKAASLCQRFGIRNDSYLQPQHYAFLLPTPKNEGPYPHASSNTPKPLPQSHDQGSPCV